jgi:hypothetical protein
MAPLCEHFTGLSETILIVKGPMVLPTLMVADPEQLVSVLVTVTL